MITQWRRERTFQAEGSAARKCVGTRSRYVWEEQSKTVAVDLAAKQ